MSGPEFGGRRSAVRRRAKANLHHARCKAAELIQTFPEVETAIRAGQLCLSTVAELARVLTPENRAEVLPRFFGLSRREAELVAAAILPAKVIPRRTTITAVRPAAAPAVVADAVADSLGVVRPSELDSPGRDVSTRLIEPAVFTAEASPTFSLALGATPAPRLEVVRPLDGELVRLNITVSREFLAKLDAAKDALGHVFEI